MLYYCVHVCVCVHFYKVHQIYNITDVCTVLLLRFIEHYCLIVVCKCVHDVFSPFHHKPFLLCNVLKSPKTLRSVHVGIFYFTYYTKCCSAIVILYLWTLWGLLPVLDGRVFVYLFPVQHLGLGLGTATVYFRNACVTICVEYKLYIMIIFAAKTEYKQITHTYTHEC